MLRNFSILPLCAPPQLNHLPLPGWFSFGGQKANRWGEKGCKGAKVKTLGGGEKLTDLFCNLRKIELEIRSYPRFAKIPHNFFD